MAIRNLISTAKPVDKKSSKKSSRVNRVQATVQAIAKITKDGIDPKALLEKADGIYSKATGKEKNLNEAFFNFSRTLEVFEMLGLIEEKDGKLFGTGFNIPKTSSFYQFAVPKKDEKPEQKKDEKK